MRTFKLVRPDSVVQAKSTDGGQTWFVPLTPHHSDPASDCTLDSNYLVSSLNSWIKKNDGKLIDPTTDSGLAILRQYADTSIAVKIEEGEPRPFSLWKWIADSLKSLFKRQPVAA